MKKKIIWIIVIIAAVFGGYEYFAGKKPVTTYTTENVKRGSLAQTVSETGTINPVDQLDLSFKVSGRVIELTADVGDTVKAGQLLAQVDLGTLSAELSGVRQDLQVQKETLASMKKNPSQYNYEDKDAQRAKIRSAEAAINSALARIRDTKMFSPADATVLKRGVDLYETTVANSPSPVFTIGNPDDLVIETEVPESDIVKVKLGQKSEVTFDALPADQIFEAEVTEIDPASTVIQDVVSYRVKLKLAVQDGRIKPGMSANIDIMTAGKDDVLMIPVRAIHMDGKQKYVDVLTDEKNNITERRNITTGLEGDEGMIEVVSGLKEGEAVITFVK
ncbi:MAG: efflux RND transporter periplasmic adaptor subunit [Candidatus Moranbacteria bacterium]|nr:efflux RND transporter periplasmic adaptor subunit [Candidatus Moranbacteria bacterium]